MTRGALDNFDGLPGGDLVRDGLRDLGRQDLTIEALLVLVGGPRLRELGLDVPPSPVASPEHALYDRLWEEDPNSAHSRYNALIRRLVSFERAAACAAGRRAGPGPDRLMSQGHSADKTEAV